MPTLPVIYAICPHCRVDSQGGTNSISTTVCQLTLALFEQCKQALAVQGTAAHLLHAKLGCCTVAIILLNHSIHANRITDARLDTIYSGSTAPKRYIRCYHGNTLYCWYLPLHAHQCYSRATVQIEHTKQTRLRNQTWNQARRSAGAGRRLTDKVNQQQRQGRRARRPSPAAHAPQERRARHPTREPCPRPTPPTPRAPQVS